ncbi:pectate lyase, partial [Alishewanella longhuensis]
MVRYLCGFAIVLITFCQPLLFAAEDLVWQAYYQSSAEIKQADEQALATELHSLGMAHFNLPTATRHFGFDIHAPDSWYKTAAGKQVAEAILSSTDPQWRLVETHRYDSSAQCWPALGGRAKSMSRPLITALRLLNLGYWQKRYQATAELRYKAAFYRGIHLIIQAQYPHGGWPQNYPLTGGYHDHVTLNDEVTEEILSLLLAITEAKQEFSFVDPELQQAAEQALTKGVALLLRIQQRDNAGLSLWAAQYEHRSLLPAWARAYEMPAPAVMESASLLEVLMQLPKPADELQQAIHSAVAWLKRHAIYDKHWHRTERVLQDKPGA